MFQFLDREYIVAEPVTTGGFVPTAALSVHLAIGQAYAFSVFNLPMTKLIGITRPAPKIGNSPPWGGILQPRHRLPWALSAAFGGKWVERVGPRKAMLASAICFCGGFLVAALGVKLHNILIVYLGYGVLGGIGLGLGYVSPVKHSSTWFPDRPAWPRAWHHGLRGGAP